eukprot:gene16243-17882_t
MSFHSPIVAANRAVATEFDGETEAEQEAKVYDSVVFDVLKVSADEIGELSCCSWSTKKKFELTPNVVNFTRRFNHVSFWVTRETLNANTAKQRAEIISHFIKIAKRLLELNNIHTLKAIVSGLQSAPIYRLIKTWSLVSKRDKDKLERLNELVSEDENRVKLRAFLENAKLPCIPYLGMYLTDLTYINTVHPSTGGLDIKRNNKMNEVLRVIADFQQSNYDFLTETPHIQKYLLSVKYIEELQKFMEDDHYRLSLKIEPNAISTDRKHYSDRQMSLNEKPRKPSETASLAGDVLRPPASIASLPLPLPKQTSSLGRSFIPSHRKSRSLGNSYLMSNSFNTNSPRNPPFRNPSDPVCQRVSSRHLLDDSLIDESSSQELHCDSTSFDSGLNIEDQEVHPVIQSNECGSGDELTPHVPGTYFKLQGFLKRKTYLKDGQKPRDLTETKLLLFQQFRVDPHKVMSLFSWSVVRLKTTRHPDLFQLVDDQGVNVYRFVAGTSSNSLLWCKYIADAIEKGRKQTPANLISFGESDDENDDDDVYSNGSEETKL